MTSEQRAWLKQHPLWPVCAVCSAPVESMTTSRDEIRAQTVVTAKCHGSVESAALDDQALSAGIVSRGIAFGAEAGVEHDVGRVGGARKPLQTGSACRRRPAARRGTP